VTQTVEPKTKLFTLDEFLAYDDGTDNRYESRAALTGASRSPIARDMPPPALVIEVVSPGTANRSRDYRHKRTEYAARGIGECWIVDPEEKKITVCKWVDGQYEDLVFADDRQIESDVVSGVSLTPQQIFEVVR
jgi:Uma2 family endonuclease